jgi:hypothetical protein
MKTRVLLLAVIPLMTLPASAQYYQQPQYHQGTIVTNPSQPVIVPPTVIMPNDQNASKKSCRESVIDLFLFTIRNTSGDCTK